MKIGFLNRGHISWTAGSSYTRSMVEAIASARPIDVEFCVIGGRDAGLPDVEGITCIRSGKAHLDAEEIGRLATEHGLDVLLPVTEPFPANISCGMVGWIPDFQHARLPEYFSEGQREERDHHFRYLVENCDAMMFSSDAVRGDFSQLYPDVETITATVPFPSSFAYHAEASTGDPAWVAEKYALRPVYAVVINQFWRHKNHRVVIEAIARARELNPAVFVVMAGMMSDSRDPTNAQVSQIVQRIFREKLFANVALLGEVPGEDLTALLRGAITVIQPSEFEGWNTTVEDALAFGKPVACSDIATHREQAAGSFFFGVDDAAALAGHLASRDWSHRPWPGNERETAALAAERDRGRIWGGQAIDLCRRAAARHRENPLRRAEWLPSPEALLRHPPLRISALEHQIKEHERQAEKLTRQKKALEDRVEKLEAEKSAARDSAAKLREDLARARAEGDAVTKKYWQERQKPLRMHLREAILGRKKTD